jgi:hypothetical protein
MEATALVLCLYAIGVVVSLIASAVRHPVRGTGGPSPDSGH